MEAGHATSAWLGLLLLIPVALYVIRRRATATEVSTLVFFKHLLREHRETAWLRRLKRWLSLALTLAMLGGTVLALMRVRPVPRGAGPRSVVLLLDRSASMGAGRADGRTLLDAAKEALRGELNRLSPAVRISLVSGDGRPEVLAASGEDRDVLWRALQRAEARPEEGREAEAWALAEVLAKEAMPAEIWWVGGPSGEREGQTGEELQRSGGVRRVSLTIPGEARRNVGITAFQLRPAPMQSGKLQAFLEVTGNAVCGEGAAVRLEGQVGGVSLPPRELTVKGGEAQVLEFPVQGGSGEALRLRVVMEGDCLGTDDEIRVRLPETKPVVAVRVGRREEIDPFAHLALQSLVQEGELQVWSAGPEQWPVQGVDVVLFDHWLPPVWPEGVAVILLSPPGGLGPVRGAALPGMGIARAGFRAVDDNHPVLFRVGSGRLAVQQTAALELAPGLHPLWMAEREPLLAAGEWKGSRVVVMNFSPHRSPQLPRTESFPLLMGNALSWCAEKAEQEGTLSRLSLRTGGGVAVKGREVRWTVAWPGGRERRTEAEPVRQGALALDRAGWWETEAGECGAAHLLSRQETLEAGLAGEGASLRSEAVAGGWRGRGWEWSWVALAAVLLALVAESALFHRWSLY